MKKYQDGFILVEWIFSDEYLLEIKIEELREAMDFYQRKDLSGLVLRNRIYFNQNNLEFLKDYPFIKKLYIDHPEIIDLRGLSYLENVDGLCLGHHNGGVDFNRVSKSLTELYVIWSDRQYRNVEKVLKLKYLVIEKSTEKIVYPKNLEFLEMRAAKIRTLDSIAHLSELKKLELHRCLKLTDISAITSLNNLEELLIMGTNHIESFAPLMNLINLKKIGINLRDRKQRKVVEESLKKSLPNTKITVW